MKKYALTAAMLVCGIVFAVEIPLRNPEFKSADGKIAGWRIENTGRVETVPYGEKAGTFAVKLSSDTALKYFGISQGGFDLAKFPRPAADEDLQITLTFRQKNENVADGGFANVSFFSKKGYLGGRDTPKRSGSFDWTDVETSVRFKEFPADARFFSLRLYLGKSTGTVYFAEPRLFVNVVKKRK